MAALVIVSGAVLARPAAATLTSRLEKTEEGPWLLTVTSDSAGDHIAIACKGNVVLLNGLPIVAGPSGVVNCAGPEAPQTIELFGEGGDDTLDTSQVTRQAGFTALLPDGPDGYLYSVRLSGGTGRNTLVGGPLSEDFNSGADPPNDRGGDVIRAGGGADRIIGTTGNDTIYGGPGADGIEPLGGADVVRGGPGSDSIIDEGVDRSHDRFYGEAGNDEIIGGAGNDLIDGGAGNDILKGLGGNDVILGGAGNDSLEGEAGNDRLVGGSGHDVLVGGAGHNSIEQG